MCCCCRFGWFLPVFTAEKNWLMSHYIVDNWRALKLDAVTAQFQLNDKHGLIKNYLTHRDKSSNLRYCSGPSCTNGIFHGRQCQSDKNKCALLLTSYPGRCTSSCLLTRGLGGWVFEDQVVRWVGV